MGVRRSEDQTWCRRISEISKKIGVRVWAGEPHDAQRNVGDRLSMRSALTPASRAVIRDPSTEGLLECSVFSLCVLDETETVIGAVAIVVERERGVFWVDTAFVSPQRRGEGIGRRLMEAASGVYHDFVETSPEHPWSGADLDAVSDRGRDIKRILNALTRSQPEDAFCL